jgi:23S rRNA (cytosine1962-C5)-methyltransferase
MEKKVILKKGKEKAIKARHHWIFSGAINSYIGKIEAGDLIPVYSQSEELLAHAYFNTKNSLSGRVISHGNEDPYEALFNNIEQAIELRKKIFSREETAYRLINGEGDLIPGLIVDKYSDYLVIQISTLGLEKLKPKIIESLIKLTDTKGIYEKSSMPTRKDEGLEPFEGNLYGEIKDFVEISERGAKYLVSYTTGQKTGFFLDQREMRSLIGSISHGKRVLNCFSYTGGFSIAALINGAKLVETMDVSEEALELAKRNLELNGFDPNKHPIRKANVVDFLNKTESLPYDICILDPPAFAKKKQDVIKACRGYKEINRQAMKKLPKGSFLLTCSCSYHVDEDLFQKVIFQSALEADRKVKIISKHRLAIDHPVNLFHKEGSYLKSLLLYLE